MTGYDRYLDFQYRRCGDFFTALFKAIMFADEDNTAALAKGFLEEVDAYQLWTKTAGGLYILLGKISPEHPMRQKFIEEYQLAGFPFPDERFPWVLDVVEMGSPLVFTHSKVIPGGPTVIGWKTFGKDDIEIEVGSYDMSVWESVSEVVQEVIDFLNAADVVEFGKRRSLVTNQ